MAYNLNQYQPLLSQLCQVLKHPDLPALLHCLTNLDSPQENILPTQENQDCLSFLQRMEELYLTKILAIQSSLDEARRTREPEEVTMDPVQPCKSGNANHGTQLNVPEKTENLSQKMTKNHHQKSLTLMNLICHGFPHQMNQPLHLETPIVRKPASLQQRHLKS